MISVNGNDVDLLGTEYCGANQDGHVWAGPGEPSHTLLGFALWLSSVQL